MNFDDQRYLIKSNHNFASIIHFFKFCLEIDPKLGQTDYNFYNHADRVFVSMLNLLILKIMQKFDNDMTLLIKTNYENFEQFEQFMFIQKRF